MINKKRFYLRSACLSLVLVIGISGCANVSYYGQSVIGHSKLMLARQSVSKVIATADEPLKSQLELSQTLRMFANQELGLPDSKSYSTYVDLKRDFPVWNVIAAPKLSLKPKQWCYPVIGCASYRGYFKQAAAHRYAEKLKRMGFDTMVGGASAYSTLGWFSDPLLPSMMRYGDSNLAETLFHELAHQQLYINGDSDFNEAFATVVGEVGAQRWLDQSDKSQAQAYRQRLIARDQFYALINKTRAALKVVYSSSDSKLSKHNAKQAIIRKLDDEYYALKNDEWDGKPLFDRWFERGVNNAVKFYRILAQPEKHDGKVKIPDQCAQVSG